MNKEETVLSFLPEDGRKAAKRAMEKSQKTGAVLSEVRLRTARTASLTLYLGGRSENVCFPFFPTEQEMRRIFAAICGGSVYAYEESIREGYVTLGGGIRVGIGGRGVVRGGRIHTLSAVESLVFRLPHRVFGAADKLVSSFRARRRGVLLFAPPGGGKTTLLREFVREISRGEGALRTAVIDTRGELCAFESDSLADILSGYPKAAGAEIAVRTLSPEVLVMDEIGSSEIETLLSLSSLGVPIVASVHGKDAFEVAASDADKLLRRGVFPDLWDVCRNALAEAV